MKKDTRKYELQLIRTRNALERKAINLTKRALKIQYTTFLDRTKSTDFRQWPQLVETISEEPIKNLFNVIYPMTAKIAVMTRKNMLKGKASEEDVIYEGIFQNKLLKLVREKNIRSITETSQNQIRKVINSIIEQTELEGWGIEKMTSSLYKEIGSNLRGNGYARARAIAQTEMISASNQAAEMAADSTGYEYRKFWSTSGLPGIRETHIEAERYSDEKNGLKPDETFPNGLLYPGDPNGSAEEVINCRCTVLHEIV